MDVLTHLPAPQKAARVENTGHRNEARVEETGAMTFSGMLEQKQEQISQPVKNPGGHKDQDASQAKEAMVNSAARGEVGQGATGTPSSSSSALTGVTGEKSETTPLNGQVMTNLMIRIQAGTLASPSGATPGSTPVPLPADNSALTTGPAGLVPTAEAMKPELLVDIQPTGKTSQTTLTTPMLASPGDSAVQGQNTESIHQNGKIQLESAPGASLVKEPLTANLNGSVNGAATQPTPQSLMQTIPQQVADEVKINSETMPVSDGSEKGELAAAPPTTAASTISPAVDEMIKNSKADKSEPTTTANMAAQAEFSVSGVNLENDNQDMDSESQNTQVAMDQLAKLSSEEGTSTEVVTGEDSQLAITAGSDQVRAQVTSAKVDPRAEALAQGRQIRQQVVRQLSTSLDGRIGNEKVTLHLNPEKLGQVEIQLAAKGNDLNIVMTAGSNEAEQALRQGIKELAEGIADKSGRFHHVDIKVEQRGQDQTKNDTRQDNEKDEQSQQGKDQRQQQNQAKQDGAPDWASLQGEG